MGHPDIPHCAAHIPEPTCFWSQASSPARDITAPSEPEVARPSRDSRLGVWRWCRKSETPLLSLFAGIQGGSWVSPSFQEGLDVGC